MEWAPYTTGTYNDPVENPFVALSDATTDPTVYVGQGDADGNFDIQNVPAGDYNLAIWDEQLSYIMRFKPVTVAAGQTVDVNDTGDDGAVGLGVSRWFGWLDGHVYKDTNGNGQLDPGEPLIANTDMDQRWRDGSIKEATFTDATGYYQYPTAEGGALGRWIVNEQGFARFSAYPGPSVHDEHTGDVIPSCAIDPPRRPANPCVPTDQGGGLLTNQLLPEGHRATVDWGKRDYPAGTPGQIVGITYFATTRNEFDARFQAHEDYEPAIPDVTVLPREPRARTGSRTPTTTWCSTSTSPTTGSSRTRARTRRTRRQHVHPELLPIRDFSGADISDQFNAEDRAELPRGAAHRRADQGRRVRRRLRVRRLLPGPGGYDLAADDGACATGRTRSRWSPAPTSPTWSCRTTRATPGPATRRTPSGFKWVSRGQGRRARRRRRLPVPAGARGGRQRRPRQPVHARASRRRRAPATTTSSTSRRWSRAASTSASPARTPRCATSAWSSCRTSRTPTPTST